jgi:hypothetical protein
LITSRNSPSENTVIGKVNRIATGRTTALTMPSSNPASTSVAGPSIVMPGTHAVASQRPSAAIAARIKKPNMRSLPPSPGSAGGRLGYQARLATRDRIDQ